MGGPLGDSPFSKTILLNFVFILSDLLGPERPENGSAAGTSRVFHEMYAFIIGAREILQRVFEGHCECHNCPFAIVPHMHGSSHRNHLLPVVPSEDVSSDPPKSSVDPLQFFPSVLTLACTESAYLLTSNPGNVDIPRISAPHTPQP